MGRAMGAEVKRLWGGASSRSEGPGGHTCLTTRSPACPEPSACTRDHPHLLNRGRGRRCRTPGPLSRVVGTAF